MHGRTLAMLCLLLLTSWAGTHSESSGLEVSVAPLDAEARNLSAEPSNLNLGSNNGSNFLIAPGTATGIAVNLSNNASFEDTADIVVTTDTGWQMSWSAGDGDPTNGQAMTLAPGSLEWIQFSAGVPEVEMGLPAAGSQHRFTVKVTSRHDGAQSSWWFTIEVMPWHGAEIPEAPVNDTVAPDLKVRVPVTVRNLGNDVASMAVRIQPVLEDGTTVEGQGPALSFQAAGWSVGIFELYNVNELSAFEEGTVLLEFDAPHAASGEMHVRFTTWSTGAHEDVQTTQLHVAIDRTRGGTLSWDGSCTEMMPDSRCEGELTLTNDGNYPDTLEIDGIAGSGVAVELPQRSWHLEAYQTVAVTAAFTLEAGQAARTTHTLGFDLVSTGGQVHDALRFEMEVGTVIDWRIDAHAESVDDLDNVTLAFTLENIGNADDGLDVTLSTNVWTQFGLIPPFTSEWESEDGTPHHFILHDIPPGTAVTFRAWVELPRDQEINGTAEIHVEMRSTLEPEIVFVNHSEHDYLAERWRPENIVEPSLWDDLSDGLLSFWATWHSFLISLLVTGVGSILLYKAVLHRQRKDAEWAALHPTETPEPERPEDWMEKFENGGEAPPEKIDSPAMPAGAFATAFQMRSDPKPARSAPAAAIVDAAHTVFEHHDERADYAAIEDLADGLLDPVEPHPSNASLPAAESVDARTIRHPRKTPEATKSDDDLDLDL